MNHYAAKYNYASAKRNNKEDEDDRRKEEAAFNICSSLSVRKALDEIKKCEQFRDESQALDLMPEKGYVSITSSVMLYPYLICSKAQELSYKEIPVGVILDMGSWVGKIVHSCMTMALSDFYTVNNHYKTRIVLHTRDTHGEPLHAPSAEVDIGLGRGCDKPLHPADMLLYSWDEELDVSHRKRVKYEAKCANIGYGFISFSFSSLGELEKDAVNLLKRIRKFFVTQDIGARVAVHIFNRISFAIAKRVGAQLVSRLPTNFFVNIIFLLLK
ncbi:hypothetical protein Tco_0289550 [Tanacetum coccineum]